MKNIILALLFLGFAACSHTTSKDSVADHPITTNVVVGESLKANSYADIFFSGQPSDKDFAKLKEQGFTSIVNLRESKEKGYRAAKEAKQAKKADLIYTHVPFKEPLTDEQIQSVTAAVVKNRKLGKTLVHCRTGNRAGLWLAGHFHKDHNFDKELSMELAATLGLKKEGLKKAAEDYLNKSSKK